MSTTSKSRKAAPPSPTVKRSTIIVAVLLVTGVALGGTWMLRSPPVDPQVAKVEELGKKLFEGGQQMTDEQRRAAFTELRKSYEQLPEETRRELRDRRGAEFMKRDQERLTQFFALSPADRKKELDKQIDEWEARRKRREADRKRSGGQANNRGGRGGPGGFGGPGGGGPGGGGPGGGGPGGGGRVEGERGDRGPGGRGGTGADRGQWQKDMLNRTTPEYRAMRDEYRREMQDRRTKRGLG